MRDDATFIGIEVDDAVAGDAELARKLEEACPVDIFAATDGGVADRRREHRRVHPVRPVHRRRAAGHRQGAQALLATRSSAPRR